MELYQHRNIDCIHRENNIKIPKINKKQRLFYQRNDDRF
jgi:hypothetical protein